MNVPAIEIRVARTEAEIKACFPILSQLRPHLSDTEFVQTVQRLSADGYQLSCLYCEGEIQTVAGFRISESFGWGRYLYVDDLVTAESARSSGHGARMFDWLVSYARAERCQQLHLESNVQRFGAHKFYLCKGMRISSHHFQLVLDEVDARA